MLLYPTLYLASTSAGRKQLLDEAKIEYQLLKLNPHEETCEPKNSFEETVMGIAQEKMKFIILPPVEKEGTKIAVLTADTLVRTQKSHTILGKPGDRQTLAKYLQLLRDEDGQVVTGCCLRLYESQKGDWSVTKQSDWYSSTTFGYKVAENMIASYFENVPFALNVASGATIEGFGAQFVSYINGSYTNVIGLPIYELKLELGKI